MAIRTIQVRERVMARNDEIAAEVRERLRTSGVVALNLISSPGSGKTLLLERTLAALGDELAIAVVAGDVQTQNDADRLAAHTRRLVQAVVTGGACHLDARQVETALEAIDLDETELLFIENVGNLVCPAGWDLGETERAVLFSVTEGDDKPAKYPRAFEGSRFTVFTKTDLLPHVPFDLENASRHVRGANPNAELLATSALSGEGLEDWFAMLRGLVAEAAGTPA